jgi:hypothetical protein
MSLINKTGMQYTIKATTNESIKSIKTIPYEPTLPEEACSLKNDRPAF